MKNFDNQLFIREEKNGITVYDINDDKYTFYEGIKYESIENKNKEELISLLNENQNLISRNIDYSYPFRLNWLIENKCNLDCIYCYASDKIDIKKSNENIYKTVEAINNLHVLNIGLTGGEPTLNPYLERIIEMFSSKCAIVLDTNATTDVFLKLSNTLKKANVLVRISIDSVDDEINKKVRPSKRKNFSSFKNIDKNIDILIKNDIYPLIHTVITNLNKNYLDDIAKYLIKKKIKIWHLYSVNYSDKCKDFYNTIKVDKQEMENIYHRLKALYSDKIKITLESKSNDFSQCAIGMIDSNGRFFLDTVYNGIKYIGKDSFSPTKDEYAKELNIKGHCIEYLSLLDENK